jgi:hypothetical protein
MRSLEIVQLVIRINGLSKNTIYVDTYPNELEPTQIQAYRGHTPIKS